MYSVEKLIKYVKNFRINLKKDKKKKLKKKKGGSSNSILKKIYVFADEYLTWILSLLFLLQSILSVLTKIPSPFSFPYIIYTIVTFILLSLKVPKFIGFYLESIEGVIGNIGKA